jgi:hypothetical protein
MTERNSLFNIISDMENDVRDIGRWAEMISLLGSSPHMVKPDVLYALSKPLALLSERLEAGWEKAFALAAGRTAR